MSVRALVYASALVEMLIVFLFADYAVRGRANCRKMRVI